MDSAHEIEIQIDEPLADTVASGKVEQWAARTLDTLGAEAPAALTIVITDDRTIQALNHAYLGIDTPTDVLAFSQTEGTAVPDAGAATRYLGDVIVSYERAVDQAGEYDEPVERELGRLVVHGVLHLLGYDDEHAADRDKMWEVQEHILTSEEPARPGKDSPDQG